jgi:asparagine synthase (glutamine-hydrolysing)
MTVTCKSLGKKTIKLMSYIDLNLRLPELLLMRVTRWRWASALKGGCHSDHRLVELAMSILQAVKTQTDVEIYS